VAVAKKFAVGRWRIVHLLERSFFRCAGIGFPSDDLQKNAAGTRRIHTMWDYYQTALQFIDGLGKQEWILILVGALAIGATFLRGFGSRTSY
jgi:hypothetical protein